MLHSVFSRQYCQVFWLLCFYIDFAVLCKPLGSLYIAINCVEIQSKDLYRDMPYEYRQCSITCNFSPIFPTHVDN